MALLTNSRDKNAKSLRTTALEPVFLHYVSERSSYGTNVDLQQLFGKMPTINYCFNMLDP
jgi:hypothetical protein